jgi:hypothetical protein
VSGTENRATKKKIHTIKMDGMRKEKVLKLK